MPSFEYHADPSPHLVITDIVDPALYARLRFPDIPRRPGEGRIGRDLYPGEPECNDVVRDRSWAEVVSTLTGREFVFAILDRFRDDLAPRKCAIQLDHAYLEDFIETREAMERAPLSTDHDPSSLFVRFDFQASDGTHGLRPPHVDHRRRIVGGVIFFCDAAEEGIVGGDFALWIDEQFTDDRKCHQPRLARSYPIRHNTGYFFLNCNDGFHGPLAVTSIAGMWKWVYFSISSRRDVWTPSRRTERASQA